MPFQSKSQQRWMYATHPKMAKEWSKETNFKQLPEKKKKKKQEGGYSTQGYKKNSPDRNNDFNIIPSSNITMQGVNHPVLGVDSTGFHQLMMPGQDYRFNSNHVFEIPIKQQGGTINTNVIDRNYGAAPELTNLQPIQFNPLGNIKQEKDDTNLSYIPMFANSIAAALANRVSNSREKNYEMTNLSNPLNYIPDTNNTNNYVNYGTPVYQEGGEVGADQEDYQDLQDDEFLFGDTTTPQEVAPVEQAPVPEEVAPQDEEYVLPIDESNTEMSSDSGDFVVSRSDGEGIASSRELDATNYLIQKGLPEHVAAGIVGNLKQESDLNPNATEKGGNGRGIAQWDVRDRFQDLKRFAAQTGRPHNDLYTQLDYLLKEADNRGDLNKIKAATNPSEAAYLFAKHFERPRTIEQIRMKNAERIFKNRKA
jgi:hypothetical protein